MEQAIKAARIIRRRRNQGRKLTVLVVAGLVGIGWNALMAM